MDVRQDSQLRRPARRLLAATVPLTARDNNMSSWAAFGQNSVVATNRSPVFVGNAPNDDLSLSPREIDRHPVLSGGILASWLIRSDDRRGMTGK